MRSESVTIDPPWQPLNNSSETKRRCGKANHQLIASRQAKQVACPLSGRDVNPSTAIEVDGVKVAFCCNGCKEKVEKADEAKRREMLFGDKAFEKGFKVEKKDTTDQ